MDYVKHPTLASELLHGQTMLERRPASVGPRQRGLLLVSDKRPDGSFLLIFRTETESAPEESLGEPQPGGQLNRELAPTEPPPGRLLSQNEVDRIRAHTDGERQLTGCAFSLDVDRPRPPQRPSPGRRPERPRSSFRDRPPKRS